LGRRSGSGSIDPVIAHWMTSGTGIAATVWRAREVLARPAAGGRAAGAGGRKWQDRPARSRGAGRAVAAGNRPP
jgi:hypothetical protein